MHKSTGRIKAELLHLGVIGEHVIKKDIVQDITHHPLLIIVVVAFARLDERVQLGEGVLLGGFDFVERLWHFGQIKGVIVGLGNKAREVSSANIKGNGADDVQRRRSS